MSRLLRQWLSRLAILPRLHRIAIDGLRFGVLFGGLYRVGRLLVAGSLQLAIRLYALQLLSIGTHVPARHATPTLGRNSKLPPFKVPRVLPASIFLEKMSPQQLAVELTVELLWLVFFILLSRWLYARGLRRYSGYGG